MLMQAEARGLNSNVYGGEGVPSSQTEEAQAVPLLFEAKTMEGG